MNSGLQEDSVESVNAAIAAQFTAAVAVGQPATFLVSFRTSEDVVASQAMLYQPQQGPKALLLRQSTKHGDRCSELSNPGSWGQEQLPAQLQL